MDIDSDDGDVFDPLLNSIISAMNSIKEATADKIYQKIRKEENTNFSKPQVDRALARALDYGIFEIHNNRYRIRDVNLDDEDTVYQKKNNKNREQTPYRSSEIQNRGDLNPERDNLRYRSPSSEENQFCPNCGRRKKPIENCNQKSKRKSISRDKIGTTSKSYGSSEHKVTVSRGNCKEKINDNNKKSNTNDGNKRTLRKRTPPKEQNRKRKIRSSSSETERHKKLQKRSNSKKCLPTKSLNSKMKKNAERGKNNLKISKQKVFNQTKRNVKPSYLQNKRPKSNKKKCSMRRRQYLSDEEKEDEEKPTTSNARSSKSKEAKSESDISEHSERSEGKKEEPARSKNIDVEEKNKTEKSGKEAKTSSNKESHLQESQWLDQPSGPFHQRIVKQTNNSLILQPMDSLPFRSPEDTSYYT